jgi:phosphoglucosamine mutase
MNEKTLFGTDGIRGIADAEWLAPDRVEHIGRSIGVMLRKNPAALRSSARPFPAVAGRRRSVEGRGKVVIGRDTRESGPRIQAALERGLLEQGVDVIDVGIAPTPVVAMLCALWNCELAIVISASHNPVEHNGIKLFAANGLKVLDAGETELEKIILGGEAFKPAGRRGKRSQAHNYFDDYLAFVRDVCLSGRNLKDLKLVLDCANGAQAVLAPRVFEKLGAEVIALNCATDGKAINDECGALYPEMLIEPVRKNSADLGVSFDGDGDRVMFVDETGVVRDGDFILAVYGRFLKENNALPGDVVVTTVMANLGLEVSLKEANIRMDRTQVGDKYVVEEMLHHDYMLGGEQSGHILFLNCSNTGDGVITALNVLKVMIDRKKSLSSLCAGIKKYPQILINVPVREKIPLENIPAVQEKIRFITRDLAGRARLVLRYSGTEKKARVMLEGSDQAGIEALASDIAQAIRAEIGENHERKEK